MINSPEGIYEYLKSNSSPVKIGDSIVLLGSANENKDDMMNLDIGSSDHPRAFKMKVLSIRPEISNILLSKSFLKAKVKYGEKRAELSDNNVVSEYVFNEDNKDKIIDQLDFVFRLLDPSWH